jgi:hypothetical protein
LGSTAFNRKSSDNSPTVQLWVDDKLVIDNWTRQRRGEEFFGFGTQEEKGTVQLVAQKAHSIFIEFCNVRGPADGDENEAVMDITAGVRLGGAEVHVPEELLESAVEVAKDADAVIAIVGLNSDWYGSIANICSELPSRIVDIKGIRGSRPCYAGPAWEDE